MNTFKVGDQVQIIDEDDADYGMVGEIIHQLSWADVFDVQFETSFGTKHISGFIPNQMHKVEEGCSYPVFRKNPPYIGIYTGIDLPKQLCHHTWKSDSYFTIQVYVTCSKCGAKKEDEDTLDTLKWF